MSGRRESGYTVVEMLIVLSTLIVVLLATLSVIDKVSELGPRDQERAIAVREAQVGMTRITRVLRQAHLIERPSVGQSSDVAAVEVELSGVERRVTFDCTQPSLTSPGTRRCVRTSQPLAGGAASVDTVLDRLTATGVFTRPAARDLAVHVEVPALGERRGEGGGHSIVLDDGVHLRNVVEE